MSTRSTIWLSPEVRGYAIHVYRETLDGRTWVDVSRGYGWKFCLSRPWRMGANAPPAPNDPRRRRLPSDSEGAK